MNLSRRNWFRMAGLGSAGAATSSRLLGAVDEYFQAAPAADATVTTLTSACGVCSPACGMKVTVKDGVVRMVEGLAGDAHGAGRLCGKGAAAAGFQYDPDRLKYPMKRTNPRKGFDEDPGWVRISWTEALDTIAQKMADAEKAYGKESLLFVTLPSPELWGRFMNAMGILNRIDHIDECFGSDRVVQRYTTGGKTWCNDFENSKYILLFGWDILAKSKLVYANGVINAKDNGAKVVHFSPQYTATSRVADEWHTIKPGTDLAVALAMISVIIGENLYNKEFVDAYTNFGQYEKEIREHFQQYTPAWASEISGVPAEAIARIAREFATKGPAIAPAHKKTLCANYMNSSQLVFAISILNILAGTVDRPGGRYFARTVAIPGVDAIYPPPAYPPKPGRRVDGRDKLPLVTEDNSGMFSTLADGMLNKFPRMIKFAFWNAYTTIAMPNPKSAEAAMKTVDFMVAMDFLPTDTVNLADIALPSAIYVEGNDVIARDYNAKKPQVVARTSAATPIFEARSINYVAIELGKRLCPDYFKTPAGEWINANTLLDEKVKRAGLAENFAEFAKIGMVTREQAFVPRTTFATPSGKCQVYVPEFVSKGKVDPLPVWVEKKEKPSAAYPYYYMTYIPAIHKRNSTQNNAILNEIMPTNAAILNPELAAKLGISEGQVIRVRSRAGQIELPAHLAPIIRADAVLVAHGFGHRSRQMTKAGLKGVRDGDLVPESSIDEFVAAKNFGGASCIMDAVCTIEIL